MLHHTVATKGRVGVRGGCGCQSGQPPSAGSLVAKLRSKGSTICARLIGGRPEGSAALAGSPIRVLNRHSTQQAEDWLVGCGHCSQQLGLCAFTPAMTLLFTHEAFTSRVFLTSRQKQLPAPVGREPGAHSPSSRVLHPPMQASKQARQRKPMLCAAVAKAGAAGGARAGQPDHTQQNNAHAPVPRPVQQSCELGCHLQHSHRLSTTSATVANVYCRSLELALRIATFGHER